jgi:hypothetical protein
MGTEGVGALVAHLHPTQPDYPQIRQCRSALSSIRALGYGNQAYDVRNPSDRNPF